MISFQDRRVLAVAGAALALVAGVAIATVFVKRDPPAPADGQARTGLQVEMSETQRLDPSRPLRCFVGGQLVGMATLADCARRNGVTAQALDVGLDESGALAAGGELAPLQPLENATAPAETAAPVETAASPPPAAQAGDGECLRYAADGWRVIGGGATSLNACVQQLFEGRCQRPGEAIYGRWGSQTLRLTGTRVESSLNNRDFTTLVEQGANCSLPPL